jgi:hypothetical protein
MQPVQLSLFAFVVALFVGNLSTPAVTCAESDLDWDPERTWVFAVGILECNIRKSMPHFRPR